MFISVHKAIGFSAYCEGVHGHVHIATFVLLPNNSRLFQLVYDSGNGPTLGIWQGSLVVTLESSDQDYSNMIINRQD